ncbi:nucleolar protein 14 [Ambystoma mexicanum]|uniref:nucleolar protein 14 n=1 Tax=Ambystoma mexicanum TaxID=8296 RepID=UPI0037E94819
MVWQTVLTIHGVAMGKVEKKRKPLPTGRKLPKSIGQQQPDVRNNPFEVKVNKQKFNILGRKTKHDVGLPGVSRSKAIKKRTATLLKEHQQRGRSSVFRDKRFGEYDTKLTPEEKMLKRFALERQRNNEKKNLYNLNEDEELTHFGQSLADIEKLNDIVDSDSENEERGALSAELTAAHFGGGGGLLRKKDPSDDKEESEKPKSRKELIEELIAKSKLDKRERQTQKENTIEMTEKLDNDWKAIQGLLGHKVPKSERKIEVEEKPKPDEYDIIVRELGFEMKAQPSDRMKTQEELAKEEEDKLQHLEAERLRRMRGEDEDGYSNMKKPKHVSADDLMDGFILDKDDRRLLSYKDGKLESQNQDEEESVKEEGSENEEVEMGSDEEASEDEDAQEEDDDDESDASDKHSDIESDEFSDEEAEVTKQNKETPKAKPKKLSNAEKKAAIEAAKAELPYTFAAPESSEELKSLLSGKSAEQQLVVLERIKKCNHPSLAVGNKAKLEKLFGFLLEYIGELAVSDPQQLATIDKMIVHLYDLCQLFPDAASESLRGVFRDAAHEMEEILEAKGHSKFPSLDMYIYLKMTAILFPTSDFWHPVVTPTLTYLSQLLIKCPVLSLKDAAAGLLLCCVFMDYISLSKRFAPELLNFLLGILHLAVPTKGNLGYTLVHPFRPQGKNKELLIVHNQQDIETWEKKKIPLRAVVEVKEGSETDANHFRLSCIALCLDLVQRCVALYGLLPAFKEIFQPIKSLLSEHLPVDELPKELQDIVCHVLEEMRSKEKCDDALVFEKKKPVPLKLFTPKIMEVLDFVKKQGSSREERERKRLIHKHKREFKGAVREIRKDSQFLARHQISEIMERDAERKRKVKQLFNSLSTQEGEWKALKRKKAKGRSR